MKHVVSGILFSTSVAFLLITDLVARLVMSVILFPTYVAYVFRAVLKTRLLISDIMFQSLWFLY